MLIERLAYLWHFIILPFTATSKVNTLIVLFLHKSLLSIDISGAGWSCTSHLRFGRLCSEIVLTERT